jgi:hypothetical protein
LDDEPQEKKTLSGQSPEHPKIETKIVDEIFYHIGSLLFCFAFTTVTAYPSVISKRILSGLEWYSPYQLRIYSIDINYSTEMHLSIKIYLPFAVFYPEHYTIRFMPAKTSFILKATLIEWLILNFQKSKHL